MSLYRTILLVDDDADDREFFVDAVKEVDPSVHCFCAKDGETALKLLHENAIVRPDIVFVDLNMPKLNGKRLLQEIKKSEVMRHVPVVMYSTFFGDIDVQEIRSSGAAFHMIKSTNFTDLLKNLQSVLTKPW